MSVRSSLDYYNLYGLDTTNHYRLYASKGVDRKNVRSKNNRLSEPGYEYSVLCNLKENHWSIPVSIERVGSIPNSSQTIDFIRSKLSLILLCMLSAIIGHVSLKKLLIFSLNSLPVLKN